MIAFEFADAFGEGATFVTPNNRLARHLVAGYDESLRRAGKCAWPAGRALPWQGWLSALWLDALATGALAAPRQLITDNAAAHLWERVVLREADGLLDAHGAATQAWQAWRLFHAWRTLDDRFEGWARAGIGDDAAAFARWAQRYRAELSDGGLVDSAQAADRLTDIAPLIPAWRRRPIVTVGFVAYTPQQERLLAAMRDAGAQVASHGLPRAASTSRRRVACATPESELDQALAWARAYALANPNAEIGIVVDELASRREEVIARAEDTLCPALALRVAPDLPRPYDISMGTPLADIPMLAHAVDLIALATAALPATRAAALLRSVYLPGGEAQWFRRAVIERRWREQGMRTVTLSDVVRELDVEDPQLAERWRKVPLPGRVPRSPWHWASDWSAWLHALGWPGARAKDSGEWQAAEAWSGLLADFGALTPVSPVLARDEALRALRDLTAQTLFQTEAPAARIRIMGVFEASGLVFDALWIAGMIAERWPPASQPNPLLPLAWQRERRIPRAAPAIDLAHAQALTDGFSSAATEVVASHARQRDGIECAGSALFKSWAEATLEAFPAPAGFVRQIAASGPEFALSSDVRASPLPLNAEVKGGVAVVESQSACPFQAFARYRLRADSWPDTSEGLTPMERGTLLHAALAVLWDEVRDHATLIALTEPELKLAIEHAAERALRKLGRARWQSLPGAVAAGESQRLANIIRAWLDRIERARLPFAVRDTELALPLPLGGIVLRARIDRVDDLATGGTVIIDYKSGRAVAPVKWFAARPSGTQVGLYALALRAAPASPSIRAVAYAQLKAGEIGVQGLAGDGDAWPGLGTPGAMRGVGPPTWQDVVADWEQRLGALAADFRLGVAPVDPRDGASCQRCDLQALCRIQLLEDQPSVKEGDDG